MPVLYCDPDDLGRVPKIWCAADLGPESPLEFDDGHAFVEDADLADRLVRRRAKIHYAGSHPDGDPDYFSEASSGDDETTDDEATDDAFDAEAFVDRTPMTDVVADIESGSVDAHLDAIEAAATRVGVQDAIDDRRD